MALVRIPGPKRQFRDTVTGKIVGRREADRRLNRVVQSNEAKAKKNKAENLIESLARPARGRKKINVEENFEEAERRVSDFQLKHVRLKAIRPQLLKTGHRAERVEFAHYGQYAKLMEEIKALRWREKPLIVGVSIGFTGHDERDGKRLDATIVPQQSPRIVLTPDRFSEIIIEYLEEKTYVVVDKFWLHLRFNMDYVEFREKEATKKRVKKIRRKS